MVQVSGSNYAIDPWEFLRQAGYPPADIAAIASGEAAFDLEGVFQALFESSDTQGGEFASSDLLGALDATSDDPEFQERIQAAEEAVAAGQSPWQAVAEDSELMAALVMMIAQQRQNTPKPRPRVVHPSENSNFTNGNPTSWSGGGSSGGGGGGMSTGGTSSPSGGQVTQPMPNANSVQVRETEGMTEAQKFEYYSNLIVENGGEIREGANEKNILQMRNPTDADTNGGASEYDDVTVMLWVDDAGQMNVREYQSNTDPAANYRYAANGGVLGRIPDGSYEFALVNHDRFGTSLQPAEDIMAERDANGDGVFDAGDGGAMSSSGRSMFFHRGGNNSTGSAGCQTFPPGEWDRFINDVQAGGLPNGRLTVTMIEIA